jgi:hypothetical protein
LALRHSLFGEIIHQTGLFHERLTREVEEKSYE